MLVSSFRCLIPPASLLLSALLSGCGDLGDNDSGLPRADIPEVPDVGDGPIEVGEVGCTVPQPIADVLRARCGPGCHTDGARSGQVDLDPARVLMDPAIIPGDPTGSLAIRVIESGTMPPGVRLAPELLQALKDWVAGLDCLEGAGEGEERGLPRGCTGVHDRVDCNPFTNAECTRPGDTCDADLNFWLVCLPPPNDVAPGGACDNLAGPFCTPGHHCAADKVCRAICCSPDDCAPGERCEAFRPTHGTLGVCR